MHDTMAHNQPRDADKAGPLFVAADEKLKLFCFPIYYFFFFLR